MQIINISIHIYLLVNGIFHLALALTWLIKIHKLKQLHSHQPKAQDSQPLVSIIFSARDEEEFIGRSCYSFLNQRYSSLEVISVNDRSRDRTGAILETTRQSFSQLVVLHIYKLPEQWIGKSHALWKGYEASRGQWLLFTDADVRLNPETVNKSISFAQSKNLDMLTVFPEIEAQGLLFKSLINGFSCFMGLQIKPWKINNPKTKDAIGIGAFNLIRRHAYEKIGTHKAFSLSLIDDVQMARMVKKAGFKADVVLGKDMVQVPWQKNVWSLIKGLEKNMFAGMGFSRFVAYFSAGIYSLIFIVPWALLGVVQGSWYWVVIVVLLFDFLYYKTHLRLTGFGILSYLFRPISHGLIIFTILRSMFFVREMGGVKWRDTFYPLSYYPKPTWKAVFRILTGRY